MKGQQKTAWFYVFITCGLAVLTCLLLMTGCATNKASQSPGAGQSGVGPAGQSEQVVGVDWLGGWFKGAGQGARIGDENTRKIQDSKVETIKGSKVEGGKVEVKTGLVHMEDGASFLLFLGALIVIAVLWCALRTVVMGVGRTKSREAAYYVKDQTHLNPLLHPVCWTAGKVIDIVAAGAKAKLDAK